MAIPGVSKTYTEVRKGSLLRLRHHSIQIRSAITLCAHCTNPYRAATMSRELEKMVELENTKMVFKLRCVPDYLSYLSATGSYKSSPGKQHKVLPASQKRTSQLKANIK